eukprot:GEMP01081795.1.p1 GENE.GEMP01081795.1~~GEMP01081795.1.p1  ORF type:complete len:194 (+),score=29.49 GEMP01081795.1:184-765(+)
MGASFYRCGFCEGVPAGTQVPNCLKQTLHLPNHINNEKYTGQVYGSKTIIMTSTVLASPPTHSSFRPTTPIKTARPTLPTTTQYSPYNAEQRGSAHLAYRLHQSSSDVPTRKVLHLYSGNNPSSNSTNGADSKTLTSAAPNANNDDFALAERASTCREWRRAISNSTPCRRTNGSHDAPCWEQRRGSSREWRK